MGFDTQQAEICLQSLDLIRLFQNVLGWNAPTGQRSISMKACHHSYRAQCIAQKGSTKIWEIRLDAHTDITLQIKTKLHRAIHKKHPYPLIVFINQHQTRSLWCWQNNYSRLQSLVFVRYQPLAGWHTRLKYLANFTGDESLELRSRAQDCSEFTQQLRQQLQQLSEAITGIDDTQDRWWYASSLLQRLIVIYILQRKGFLNNDIWYLHNQLGRSQQQRANIFFQQFLQPIFIQGFSLPVIERSQKTHWMGQIPYLGDLFYSHSLEAKYTKINIADMAFESILVWFESPLWQRLINNWQLSSISIAFESVLTDWQPMEPEALVESQSAACELVINQFLLEHLNLVTDSATVDIWDILFSGELQHLRNLVQTSLPKMSIMDPACGVGGVLIELQAHLVDIYSTLIGHLNHLTDSQLQIWLEGVKNEHSSLLQTIHRRIFKYGLYGVDLNPAVLDSARFQLLFNLIIAAQDSQDIEPLPNLDFNIVLGNSLIGFLQVDEAGFDRLYSTETLLQGNLLQPLAAETYQTILAEKRIALEYYYSRTHVLEELQQNIPRYAQSEFFRDQINYLDTQAQAKLDELLLTEFSQTLGIRFRAAQLIESPRQRLLKIDDIAALNAFHWGYHFNQVLEQDQGFNIILSRPPQGPCRPTIQEFFYRFAHLTFKYKMDIRTFKSVKRFLSNVDSEVARAWLGYQSQYSLMADYFYRSPQYERQSPVLKGKRHRTQLYKHWLFTERCFNLLAPRGICGLLVANDIKDSPRGMALRSLLEKKTDVHFLRTLPRNQKLSNQCFLWFVKH
ncbi:MAG: hypothetical protein AAF821_16580 [Cyanobacteria bacterium P01_D01_bin.156]